MRAKRFPENRVDAAAVEKAASGLSTAERRIQTAETEAAKKQSVALHEIRKLNARVKQTAERLCQQQSPLDIDSAAPELVRILKAAELMSNQFDVLELLANEGLASLPRNTRSDVYRMFDKCVRIYRPENERDRISIWTPGGSGPMMVDACDKTFPIIPTVLLENAIKYSLPGSRVEVAIRPDGKDLCVVSVSSLTSADISVTPAIFERGVRGSTEIEGSGNGLFLAQLIARQHKTIIELDTTPFTGGRQRVTFSLRLPMRN